MGMAASQARLLCITARIHDVEYQAQSIQNAKIQLATQSDRAYQEYNEALEATTLTISTINPNSGEKATVPATFNNLCSRNRSLASNGERYALRNQQGLLVVEDEIEEGYYDFKTAGLNDPYQFALYMMDDSRYQFAGNIEDFPAILEDAEESCYENLSEDEKSNKLSAYHEKLMELTGGESIYDCNDLMSSEDNEKIKEYEETLAAYRKELYRNNTQNINNQIYVNAGEDPLEEDLDLNLFNYFVSIYNQINACGGCVSIDDYDGLNGDASNDNVWLQNMIQSGQFTIEVINTDKHTGEVSLDATSPASDSCLAYTNTTAIDNRALAKAEAKYEHTLKEIDKKDQKYDLDLSKLETERTALTTEYESIKTVINDNIERTFGIFS